MCGPLDLYYSCKHHQEITNSPCPEVVQGKVCPGPTPRRERVLPYVCKEHWIEQNEPGEWPGKKDGYDDPDKPKKSGAGETKKKQKKTKSPQGNKSAGAPGGGGNGTGGQQRAASGIFNKDDQVSVARDTNDGEMTTDKVSALIEGKQHLQAEDDDKENQGEGGDVEKGGVKQNVVEKDEEEDGGVVI